MQVTIVIVNWNGGQLLMRCLASIRAHAGPVSVAVIVIDNDSSDGSREAAAEAFPEFRVINSGANLGFGRANNLTRDMVDTPLVLFLNPDTELMAGSLEHAVRCIGERPDVGIVGCKMLCPDGEVQELGLQWQTTPSTVLLELLLLTSRSRRVLRRWLPEADPDRSAYVRKLYGGFMLVRRDILEKVGWFDERYFMYAEDADMCRTVSALGWKLYYCSESVIMHVGGGVTAAAPSAFTILMQMESINKLIAKYQGSSAAMLHRGAVFIGGLSRLAAAFAGRAVTMWSANKASAGVWRGACFKHQRMVLWSVGLRKAAVPTGAAAKSPHRQNG